MEEIIIEILNEFGYLGVFLLITIENIFPPIPSEIILTLGGFMTTYTSMNIAGVILAATAGSTVGAVLLYAVGRLVNTQRLERLFASRLGRLLHLKKQDVRRAERWFLRRGNKAVFFCRFIPIVRSLISIPAGIAEMRFGIFLALTFAGTLLWNTVLVLLGMAAGAAWETVALYVDIYAMIAAAVFIVIAALVGAVFIKKRFFGDTADAVADDSHADG